MLLITMLVNFIPMRANALQANHFGGESSQVVIKIKESSSLGGLVKSTANNIMINDTYLFSNEGDAIVDVAKMEHIEPDKWSTLDLVGIASDICSDETVNKQSNYSMDIQALTVPSILTSFKFDKNLEDPKMNSELGLFRDCVTGLLYKRIKEDPTCIEGREIEVATKCKDILDYYKYMFGGGKKYGGVTGIFSNGYGIQSYDDLNGVLGTIVEKELENKTDNVRNANLADINTAWDDNDLYESTKRAVMFLTEESIADPSKLGVVIGAKNSYGIDNANRTKYISNFDSSNVNQQILNSIIWTMIHDKSKLTTTSQEYAILSLIQQRGSKYSYGKGGLVGVDKELTLDKSVKTPGIEANLKDLNTQLETIIKKSSLSTTEEKTLYTTGLRMQYAFYAMQYDGTIPYNMATQLTIEENAGNSLRLVSPLLAGQNYVQNIKGYTMLNNVCNEISYTAEVILPTLGGITTKEGLNANTKQQLRYLRSAYDAWIFMRDKSRLTPQSAIDPLKDAWTKQVKLTGKDTTTSLAETFDRLSQFIDLNESIMDSDFSNERPLRNFIDSKSSPIELASNLKYGIALSASYIPFKTNVYETVTYKQLVGKDEFFNFHVLYGYYRKPLYIDTNISSVSENFVSGRVGNLKLSTLKDVLQCEKEITLYTDDNFYNIYQLEKYKEEAINRQDTSSGLMSAAKAAGSADLDKIAEEYAKQKIAESTTSLIDKIKNANEIDLKQVLKTDDYEKYPAKMNQVKDYEASKKDKSSEKLEEILLNGNDIDIYLGNGENNQIEDPSYNVMRSYAITSAIARDKDVLNLCNNSGRLPVFKSSKNIAKMEGASKEWKSTIINYLILKNIQANMNVSYSSNLDLNKPVYMDVYGNIVTDSGFVVIPAASNATLNKSYEAYNAGFLTTYGKEYSLSADYSDFIADSPLKTVLSLSKDKKFYELQGKQEQSDVIDLSSIILSNESQVQDLVNVYAQGLDTNFNTDVYIPNVLLEVLRGAPLENIDKAKEGVVIGNTVGDNGIEQAAKLELFQANFLGKHQAAVLSLPNIAFYSGIEFLIPLLLKIVIIGVLLMTFKYVYLLGVKRQFALREIARYFAVLTLTLAMIFVIPKFFNFCYYWSNKALLQEESLNIAMLNYEKKEAGLEVGVQDVTEANPKTILYLKMKDLSIPWYTVMRDISLSPVTEGLTKLYTNYAEKDLAYSAKNFKFVAGDLYISVDDLLDATSITFNPAYKQLYDVSIDETPASFYTPYYIFLKNLTIDSNMYNTTNNIFSYSAQTYKDGKIKSLGLIKPFMESSIFTDEEDTTDILHLKQIYNRNQIAEQDSIMNPTALSSIQGSNWCNMNITDAQFNERYDKINKRAKKFVAEHQSLLGRISDETFLKMMALDLAMCHNQYFNVQNANSLEIFNLSSEDIARLATVPKSEVIITSPLSFARFIYEEGGEVSVYFATILLVLFFINSWVSPIVTIFVFVAIFSSLFMRKIVFEKEDDSIKGYFFIALYMGGTCLAYAGLMKLSTLFTSFGFTPVVNILFLIIVHIAVIMMMLFIGAVVMLNWKDLGAAEFSETTMKIGHIMKAAAGYGSKITDKVGQSVIDGKNKLSELMDRRDRRKNRYRDRNLYDYNRYEDEIMDDSRISRWGNKGRFRDNNKNNNSSLKYTYDGGKYVDVYKEHGVDRLTVREYVEEYGKKPQVNRERNLTDRVRDKWDN